MGGHDVGLRLLAGLASISLLAGCGAGASPTPSFPPAAFELRGTVVLVTDFDVTADGCRGADDGEYRLIADGTDVTVVDWTEFPATDGGPPIVAATRLGPGHVSPSGFCVFAFSTGVPDIEEYDVEVEYLGGMSFTRDDLVAAGWEVEIRSDALPPVERGNPW